MIGEIVYVADGEGRKRSHTIVACSQCENEFPKATRFLKKSTVHYCSSKCASNGRITRIRAICSTCGIEHDRRQYRNTKSGLQFCSRVCKESAQTRKSGLLRCGFQSDSNYRGIAFDHYPHHCEWCKDDFVQLLDVHHIDHSHDNNDVSNLMILCVGCHALETRKLVEIIDRKMIIIREHGLIIERFKRLGIVLMGL